MSDTLNTKETFAIISNLADIYKVRHGELIPMLGQYIDTPIVPAEIQIKALEMVLYTHDLLEDTIAIASKNYEFIHIPVPGDVLKKLHKKRLINRKKRKQRK